MGKTCRRPLVPPAGRLLRVPRSFPFSTTSRRAGSLRGQPTPLPQPPAARRRLSPINLRGKNHLKFKIIRISHQSAKHNLKKIYFNSRRKVTFTKPGLFLCIKMYQSASKCSKIELHRSPSRRMSV